MPEDRARPASVGDPVRVVMSKWDGRPHWQYAGVLLGSDEHGEWLGYPAGSHFTRPGLDFRSVNDQVVLVPAVDGSGARPWWMAGFHAPGAPPWPVLDDSPVRAYTDVTTPPSWVDGRVHAVDLDLDVVLGFSGAVHVDDEDEFAEHRVALGYPADVVAAAEASCATVAEACRRRTAPFDEETSQGWLRVLRDLSA